jgi:hypothetical protein
LPPHANFLPSKRDGARKRPARATIRRDARQGARYAHLTRGAKHRDARAATIVRGVTEFAPPIALGFARVEGNVRNFFQQTIVSKAMKTKLFLAAAISALSLGASAAGAAPAFAPNGVSPQGDSAVQQATYYYKPYYYGYYKPYYFYRPYYYYKPYYYY